MRGERKELREEQLLEQVYREVLPEFRERYEELSKKLHQETLTDKEQKELTRYTDAMETRSVERLQALIQLARLRKTTLDALMKDLGLGRRSHA